MTLRYVLIADGRSDDVLHHPIRWSLRRHRPELVIGEPVFEVRRHRPPIEVVAHVLEEYRPDLVLVHRDAEKEDADVRRREVPARVGVVPIVPVRMTEAWLLFHEPAIRQAVSRPRAADPLTLPSLRNVERRPDPKADLEAALLAAAGTPTGRDRKRLRARFGELRRRVAEEIPDFAPLLELQAFRRFHDDLGAALP